MIAGSFLGVFLDSFVTVLAGALRAAILVQVLRSWVPFQLPFGLDAFVREITEPILGPLRRALPFAGGLDFSPFVALVAIQAVESILRGLLRSV